MFAAPSSARQVPQVKSGCDIGPLRQRVRKTTLSERLVNTDIPQRRDALDEWVKLVALTLQADTDTAGTVGWRTRPSPVKPSREAGVPFLLDACQSLWTGFAVLVAAADEVEKHATECLTMNEHAIMPFTLAIDAGVEAAIASRRSVRGFIGEAVPLETVRHILALASRAPSMTNTQPWHVHVLIGAALAALKSACREAHRAGQHWQAEYDYYPSEWTPPYLERRRQIGWALYGLLGIAQGDRAASHQQHERNYDFFSAPVGIILTTARMMRAGSYIDLGMLLGNIAIAGRGYGLHTCSQAAFAFMHPIIRAQLGLRDTEIVVCGMALGHIDPAEPANALRTVRASVDEFATSHGN